MEQQYVKVLPQYITLLLEINHRFAMLASLGLMHDAHAEFRSCTCIVVVEQKYARALPRDITLLLLLAV